MQHKFFCPATPLAMYQTAVKEPGKPKGLFSWTTRKTFWKFLYTRGSYSKTTYASVFLNLPLPLPIWAKSTRTTRAILFHTLQIGTWVRRAKPIQPHPTKPLSDKNISVLTKRWLLKPITKRQFHDGWTAKLGLCRLLKL